MIFYLPQTCTAGYLRSHGHCVVFPETSPRFTHGCPRLPPSQTHFSCINGDCCASLLKVLLKPSFLLFARNQRYNLLAFKLHRRYCSRYGPGSSCYSSEGGDPGLSNYHRTTTIPDNDTLVQILMCSHDRPRRWLRAPLEASASSVDTRISTRRRRTSSWRQEMPSGYKS